MITVSQLKQLLPKNPYVEHWHHALEQLFPDYDINTPRRMAAFVAQCAHESGGFMVLKENLNYKAASLRKIFPKYFPTLELAKQYERNPKKIASRVYANRMGNGDEASQEGWVYRGRGILQLTGKNNYFWFAASLEITTEEAADYLESFEGACQSACWFWREKKLNRFVDADDFKGLNRAINGGYIGYEDRKHHSEIALSMFDSAA